jgi:hypothetical protein
VIIMIHAFLAHYPRFSSLGSMQKDPKSLFLFTSA